MNLAHGLDFKARLKDILEKTKMNLQYIRVPTEKN